MNRTEREQRTTRRTITGIALAGALAMSSLVGMTATATAAEAAYVPTRYAHPVHGKRPQSPICWAFRICKTERICWYGNPNIAYSKPTLQRRYCITYKY